MKLLNFTLLEHIVSFLSKVFIKEEETKERGQETNSKRRLFLMAIVTAIFTVSVFYFIIFYGIHFCSSKVCRIRKLKYLLNHVYM